MVDLMEDWEHLGFALAALGRWAVVAVSELPHLTVAAAVGAGLGSLWLRSGLARDASPARARPWERILALLAVVFGLFAALDRAALFDDAYISFRYAQNLVEGHGLVFNVGERVEGYTNFLWTVLLAGLHVLTRVDLDVLGLWGSLVAFAALLLVTARFERRLAAPFRLGVVVPWAALWLSVQHVMAAFGTTGLETGFTALLVTAGALVLVGPAASSQDPAQEPSAEKVSPGRALAASTLFILATLSRPDQAIFYAVGGVLVTWERFWPWLGERRRGGRGGHLRAFAPVLAWAAPLVPYVVYLVVKARWYGDWLPNTAYAKSAGLTYYSQGLVYTEVFYLSSHFWLVGALFLAFLVLPTADPGVRRFKRFALPAVVLHHLYVARVGGDFMHGRFFVSVMPLLVLGAVQVFHQLEQKARVPSPRGVVLVGAFVAASGGIDLVPPGQSWWHIADESSFYALKDLHPPVVDHMSDGDGRTLRRLYDAGVHPLVATSGVGMLGYHSRLQIIDLVGLVDPVVAHQRVKKRGRPGHEKWADLAYIAKRRPHLVRSHIYMPAPWRSLTRITWSEVPRSESRWFVYRWDAAFMKRLAEVLPEADFVDVPDWIDDFLRRAPRMDEEQVTSTLTFLETFYFQDNPDPRRRKAFTRVLEAKRRAAARRPTAGKARAGAAGQPTLKASGAAGTPAPVDPSRVPAPREPAVRAPPREEAPGPSRGAGAP